MTILNPSKGVSYRPASHTHVPNPRFTGHERQRGRTKQQLRAADEWAADKNNLTDNLSGDQRREQHVSMPRHAEPESLTPFAMVLTDYMWNKRPPNRPPLTTPQLAVRLQVPRQSVNNWIYKGNVPPLEAVLAILAQLDIPLRALYDAYKRAGLSVPRWEESDSEGPQLAGRSVAQRSKKQTTLPIPTNARPAPTTPATPEEAEKATAPHPYVAPAPYDPIAAEAEEYDRIVAQTQASMRASGMPESLIADLVAHIRARQAQPPDASPIQQHLIEEHTDSDHMNQPGNENAQDTTSTSAPSAPASGKQQRPGAGRRSSEQ